MWICVYLAKSDGTHEHVAMDLESHFTCCLPSHCHPQDELSAAHLPGLTHQLSLPWSGPEAQRGLGSDTYQTASCCAGPGATEVQLKLCKCPFVSRNTKLNSYWKHQNIPVKREIIGKKNAFFFCFLNMLVPSCFSHVWFFVTLCTVAHQASLSIGILWAWILEWVAISYSRGSSQSKDWTHVSCIGRRILYHCATWEDLCINISLSHFAIHLKLTWYYKSAILQYKNVLGQEK